MTTAWSRQAFVVLAMVLLLIAAGYWMWPGPAHDLTFTWDYQYGNYAACDQPQQRQCLAGFRIFVSQGQKRVWQTFVPNQSDTVGHMRTAGLSAKGSARFKGEVALCVAAVARFAPGVEIESDPVCAAQR